MTENATQGGHALSALRLERTTAAKRMTDLATAARGRSMTDDEQHDFDAASRQVTALEAEIAAMETKGGTPPALPAPPKPPLATGDPVAVLYQMQAAAVADLCVKGGAPEMAASLIAEGVSVEEAGKRIAPVGEARAIMAIAGKMSAAIPTDLAATMLAEGKNIQQIRTEVLNRLAAESDKIELHTQKPAAGAGGLSGGQRVDLAADMRRRHGIKA